MKSKLVASASAVYVALSISLAPVLAEPTDDPVASAVAAYKAQFQEVRDAGEWPSTEQRGEMVDEALAGVAVDALTLDRLDELMDGLPLTYGRARDAADAALAGYAKSPDADGARAAGMRLRLTTGQTTQADRAARIQAVFSHPGLGAALAQGYAMEPFRSIGRLDADQLMTLHADFVGTESLVDPALPAGFFARMAGTFFAFANVVDEDALRAQEPLRVKLVETIDAKLAEADLPDDEAKTLTNARTKLNGAFARGMLVGHTAPELNFSWWSNPADENETYAKLSDLTGKVVVLDFWATWCGPCVGSFPHVKELQSYYDGYDVVIIGVTSIQGSHYTGDDRGKIDTTDDPAKEMELMREFMGAKEVTWRVAFADEPVFNPDYGVNGIPHVVIIDPQGVVRFRGLHPAMPMVEKTSKIDELLIEAGKPAPTPPALPDEAVTDAEGSEGGQ